MGFRPRPPETHIDSTLVSFRHGVTVGNFDGWVKDLDEFLEGKVEIRGQFHQRSTSSFYVRKLRTQLFCAYVLGLYFTGIRLLAQKLRVECW
jgi:hypothetical protein